MGGDLISMLGHLSHSLFAVQSLVAGFGYLLGLTFIITALMKFSKSVERSSSEKMLSPAAFLLGGVLLMFLPSTLTTLSNTAFGRNNILEYMSYSQDNIYSSMGILLKTVGLIWFIRGSTLLIHSSEPGAKHGPKGLVFLIAGILAMNYTSTVGMLTYILTQIINATNLTVKK